jgi:hypothetical protein
MSKLRPTTQRSTDPTKYSPATPDLYFHILQAVQHQKGLIHGKLNNCKGEHCALGSYWGDHPDWCVQSEKVDEIAAVNDSAPTVSMKRRKEIVIQWLKWKLRCYGFNYRAAKPRIRK